MDFLNSIFPNMNSVTKRAIAFTLVAILVFSAGFMNGSYTRQIDATLEGANVPAAAPAQTQPAETQPATTQPAQTQPAETQPADTQPAETDPTTPAETEPAATGAPQTKEEIVAYFNTAANKIKTDATVVTRNWEDLQHNEEKLEVPSILKSIGSTLISTFLKKDETPVDMTGDDMKNNFPVKNQAYVSQTTAADLTDATITDNGDSYTIKLTYIDADDPTNTSVANAFNIINPDDVYSAASIVKEFSAHYYSATIECTIDKASGHVTHALYTLPIVLSVKAMGVNAKVGMTFIDDYSMTY